MKTATETTVNRRVVIDLDRCIECGSCAAACYYAHARMPVVHFARAGFALLPVLCRQCKAAACVEACPVEAMVRDEHGVVRRLAARCIGCGSCARACPFGVIPLEKGGLPRGAATRTRMSGFMVAKCDLCADRTENGRDAVPRCVAACPAGALLFVDEHRGGKDAVQILGGRSTGDHPFKRR